MKLFTIPSKILNFRLFTFVAVSLCLGITSAYFFLLKNVTLGVVICAVFAVSVCAYLFIKVSNGKGFKVKSVFCLVFALFFVIGNLSLTAVISDYERANLGGHYYTVTARIAQNDLTDSGSRLLLDNISISGDRTGKLTYKAYAYVYGENYFDIGDVISFYGSFTDRSYVYENELSTTNIMRGVKYMIELSAHEISVENNGILSIFERVNIFIRNTLKSGLDEREFTLSYALLTGKDDLMDYDLLNNYRSAGVAHVFAVSGLHIGFLAFVLGFIFDKLKFNRLLKAVAVTLLLIFYSGVCGFSASSLRATIMVATSLFLLIKGLRYDAISSLSLSAIIVLLLAPEQLFFVGFQLSFTVALGIVLLSKQITKLFKFLPKKIASSIGVVLSAQIVSIPICLLAFNQFSTIAVIANIIFIPVISGLFVVLLVMTLLGGAFNIPVVALFLPNYVLKFVNMCISAFDYDIFIVGGIAIGGFALLYYAVVLITSDLFNFKRVVKTIMCISLSLVFFVGVTCLNFNKANVINAHIIGSDNLCVTAITTPKENLLIVSKANKIYSASRLKRLKQMQGVSHFDKVIILGGANNDEQVFLTKLHTVFTFETVYYFGERNPLMEQIVSQSFKGVQLVLADDGQNLAQTFDCCYRLNGLVADITIGQNKIAIFASIGGNRYHGLNGQYQLIVCVDMPKTVGAYYSADICAGYRARTAQVDGESRGTLTFRFN